MEVILRPYDEKRDAAAARAIFNEVIEEGNSIPQTKPFTEEEWAAFASSQTHVGVAADQTKNELLGLYILHPLSLGRIGGVANATYAVASGRRGEHVGERLVQDSLKKAREYGFSIMAFIGVVDSNLHARHLYERVGFQDVGLIPGAFQVKDGHFEDVHVMYCRLD